MKILLTGVNGQIGWELARTLLPLGEIIEVSRAQADLCDLPGLRKLILDAASDVIINPAAYTAVDKAESERDLAFKINAEAPALMAEEARKTGALFIHYSTDYVFDGADPLPYAEADPTAPLNVYGQSKLAGEQAIQASGCDFVVLRTSWVFSGRGNNFVKTMLRLAMEREELKIVDDQAGAPTWARLVAEVTAHVLRQTVTERQAGVFRPDIYHLTSSGATSWYGFAQAIVNSMRDENRWNFKNRSILPIATSEYPLPAKRPHNSLLSTRKLEQHFGLVMPGWENSLRLCLQELK